MRKIETNTEFVFLRVLRRVLLISIFFFTVFAAYSQRGNAGELGGSRDSLLNKRPDRILRDTVKNNYNAKTTRFTFEKNFKFNDLTFYNPDTIPDNLHRFTDLEKNNNFIQNLGGIGTALRPLFYEAKSVIGRTSGYHAYDAFYIGPDQIKYFDTRSPYTDINATFGGGGRAITDVLFSFNDSTQFNLGFSYSGIRADKQLSFLTRGDRSVESTNWNIFGFLRPKKLPRYLLLFNMTQMKHVAAEQGGIVEAITMPTADSLFYDYQDENVALDEAESYDKRGGLHIYQQYDLDSVFQFYHSATLFDQVLRYNDTYDLSTSDSLIYSSIDNATSGIIADRTAFREFTNEFGIKGLTKKFAYTLFYRNRSVRYDNLLVGSVRKDSENYLGGTLRQQITPKIFLKASGEYLIGGNYLITGDFNSDLFTARFSRVKAQPNYLAESYGGEQRSWTNTFNDEVSDNLYGEIKLNTKRLSFRPFLRFNRITDHLFFGPDRLPQQASGDIVLFAPGINFDYKLTDKWAWKSTVAYSTVSGGSADVYRIPELMVNAQLAHTNILFDGKMIIQTGMDVHYRTAYQAYAYDPTVQQFYQQSTVENDAFVKIDLFLNFKVQNFIFFVKSGHFNQGLIGDGYFLTPYFTGTVQTLDIGARWSFYD